MRTRKIERRLRCDEAKVDRRVTALEQRPQDSAHLLHERIAAWRAWQYANVPAFGDFDVARIEDVLLRTGGRMPRDLPADPLRNGHGFGPIDGDAALEQLRNRQRRGDEVGAARHMIGDRPLDRRRRNQSELWPRRAYVDWLTDIHGDGSAARRTPRGMSH